MKIIYLSPGGDDNSDGSACRPMRSVARALSAAGGGAEIILSGGCYHEYEAWKLSGSDITIRNADGERPVISGGVRVNGWKPAGDANLPGLMRAPLPDKVAYARNFYVNGRRAVRAQGKKTANVGWQLIDDPDMRLHRLTEEFVSMRSKKRVYEGYITTNTDMLNWRNPSDIEFVYDAGWTHCIVPVDGITPEGGKAFIKMREPCFRACLTKEGVQIGGPNYIENAYELLGEPGQWYIDRAGKSIYYLPLENENVNDSVCIIPVTESFIDIGGTREVPAKNITIRGLTFAYSSWLAPSEKGYCDLQANLFIDGVTGSLEYVHKAASAVSLKWCGNVRIEECYFKNVGANAVDVDKGVSHAVIDSCKFENVSGSGIQIGRFNEEDAHPGDVREIVRNITVCDNYLTDTGAEYTGALSILAGYVQDLDIAHNEISHTSYSGISLGWGWGIYEPDRDSTYAGVYPQSFGMYSKPTVCMRNRIMYNHIHDVMEKMHDGAGIYTLGLQNGSVIKGNYIHDNAFSGERGAEAQYIKIYEDYGKSMIFDNDGEPMGLENEGPLVSRPAFPGGIYLDEASGGFYVCENVVHSVSIPFFLHDTGTTNRRTTNFIFENHFNAYPDDMGFPAEAAAKAGISPERGFVKDYALDAGCCI